MSEKTKLQDLTERVIKCQEIQDPVEKSNSIRRIMDEAKLHNICVNTIGNAALQHVNYNQPKF